MLKFVCVFAIATMFFNPAFVRAEQVVNEPSAPIQLSLGGFMNWYGTYAYNKTDMFQTGGAYAGTDYNKLDLMADAEIYFKGETLLDNGMKIGVMAQLEAGTDDAFRDRMWDEVYMFVEGNFGQFLIGSHKNITNRMAVNVPTASNVIGAEETYLTRILPIADDVSFLDTTYSKVDYLAPKLAYISPTVNGVTLAVSGTTANDTRGHDDSVLYALGDDEYLKHGVIGLARFDKEFEADSLVSQIQASVYYANFKPNDPVLSHNEQEFGAGLVLSFGGLSFGSSYRRVLADTQSAFSDWQGFAVNTGILYEHNRWAVSANWYASRTRGDIHVDGDDKVDLYLASAKYKLGAGVDTFIDIGYMTMKDETNDPKKENEGIGTAVGFALAF